VVVDLQQDTNQRREPKFALVPNGFQFGLAGKVFACLVPGSVKQSHNQKMAVQYEKNVHNK